MAKTVPKPSRGLRVYRIGSPQKAGVIIEVLERIKVKEYVSSFWNVRVRWVNGTEEVMSNANLNDFDELIADHQKKLNTHLAMKARLEKMMGVSQ